MYKRRRNQKPLPTKRWSLQKGRKKGKWGKAVCVMWRPAHYWKRVGNEKEGEGEELNKPQTGTVRD